MEKSIIEIITDLEKEADDLEKWIKNQSDAYLQTEDQGTTMIRVREIRRVIKILRENEEKE